MNPKNTIIKEVKPSPNRGIPYTGIWFNWGMALLYVYWIVMFGLIINACQHHNSQKLDNTSSVRYK